MEIQRRLSKAAPRGCSPFCSQHEAQTSPFTEPVLSFYVIWKKTQLPQVQELKTLHSDTESPYQVRLSLENQEKVHIYLRALGFILMMKKH